MKTNHRTLLAHIAPTLVPDIRKSLSDQDFAHALDLLGDIIQADQGSAKIVSRWRAAAADPLKYQRHPGLARDHWRRGRSTGDNAQPEKLARPPATRFGAAASTNFTIVEETEAHGKPVQQPVTREEFYDHGFAAVEAVAAARGIIAMGSAEAWAQLARDLDVPASMNDWPGNAPPPREFVRQLAKDLYFIALGRRDGWPQDYAQKSGALRKPGNAFSAQDVRTATDALAALLPSVSNLAPAPLT